MIRRLLRPLRSRLARTAATAGCLAVALCLPAQAQAACIADGWPLWNQFARIYLQPDGRIVDASLPEMHSTSESQSYGMFFALVANDRAAFERIWDWSVNNLMGGDAASVLPAWRWGQRPDGTWGVLDPNAASDADLWFAYTLLEAARLWDEPRYERPALALLRRAAAEEVVSLPGLGPMLLPGPHGFALKDQIWRLNPSYQPVPVLRLLARHDPSGPWAAVTQSSAALIQHTSPYGFVPDWGGYQATGPASGQFIVDPVKGDVGSYDAIRTYLWAGMTAPSDPLAAPILRSLGGMARVLQNQPLPPETVHSATGVYSGSRGFGFVAALLPYLQALGFPAERMATLRQAVDERLAQDAALSANTPPPAYYDYMLSLFGLGYMDQHYRFLASGALQTRWESSCRAPRG